MRNPKRIPIALRRFQNQEILKDFLEVSDRHITDYIYKNWSYIEKKWTENPNMRFGQVLCSLRLIPDLEIENRIWNVEETKWLIKNEYLNKDYLNE